MNDAARHIVKARETLGFARYALTGAYTEEARRSTYMAAYRASLAFIVARTEFARLARSESSRIILTALIADRLAGVGPLV